MNTADSTGQFIPDPIDAIIDVHIDRQPNAGTALSGPRFSARNRPLFTRDVPSERWIALDEAGWDGDQLFDRDRYLIVGSVAVSDDNAADIVEFVRRKARIQSHELKFSGSFTSARHGYRRQVLVQLLGPRGPLEGQASVYIVDKHYFITSKLVDLFIEERAHARGFDIRNSGTARNMARILAVEGRRALGSSVFEELLATTVAFTSRRNRNGQRVSVEKFFEVIDGAWKRSHRRKVTEILQLMRGTRAEANSYLKTMEDSSVPSSMEPLYPSMITAIGSWSERIGRVNALLDDQKVITDQLIDIARAELSGQGYPEFRHLFRGCRVGQVVRGQSQEHPSLQLADLISGAGFQVARRHAGMQSAAGDDLYPAIIPLIDPAGMLPHDEPARLAVPNGANR